MAGDRLVMLPLRPQRIAEGGESGDEFGVDVERGALGGRRRIQISGDAAGFAQIQPIELVAGCDRRGLGDQLSGPFRPAELERGEAQKVQRFGMARRAIQNFPVEVAGFFEIAGTVMVERGAEGGVERGIARVRPCRTLA